MSYGDPGPQHRNAVAQIDAARTRAAQAVSEVRQRGPPPHQPYLAPTDGDGPELSTFATQAVVDYLEQLRPYRHQSRNWQADLGTIQLPETVPGRGSKRRGGRSDQSLHICQNPVIDLGSVDNVVKAANMSITYSSKTATRPTTPAKHELKTGTDEYGTLLFDDTDALMSVYNGDVSFEEAVEYGFATREADVQEATTNLKLGDPDVQTEGRGAKGQLKNFNLVYPEEALKSIMQIAESVANEMDLLIERDDPDYGASGGDAV